MSINDIGMVKKPKQQPKTKKKGLTVTMTPSKDKKADRKTTTETVTTTKHDENNTRTIALSILVGALAISYSIYHQSSMSSLSGLSYFNTTSNTTSSSLMLTLEQAFNMTELSMLSFDELFGRALEFTASTSTGGSSKAEDQQPQSS
jgi:hypothetical protein